VGWVKQGLVAMDLLPDTRNQYSKAF